MNQMSDSDVRQIKKKSLLEALAKEDLQVISLAYVYAKHMQMYGEDVTKATSSATQNAAMMDKAYQKGYYDAMNKNADRWIPVSPERLPDEGADVFVTYVDGEEVRTVPVNYGSGTWFDCIFNSALDPLKITAWMQLPKPYEAGNEDQE